MPREKVPLRIDPIDPSLPGRLNINALASFREASDEQWVSQMVGLLRGPTEIGGGEEAWCGLRGIPQLSPTDVAAGGTGVKLSGIVSELASSILERKSPTARAVLSKLFLVPKTQEVSRIILDCRPLNKLGADPPYLSFASIKDFFRILSFFNESHTVTADFRHWFFQLPLPLSVRDLFSLRCGNEFFRLKVWAMGFAWSPFAAQAVSMSIARRGIRRSGRWHAVGSMICPDAPPPFWVVSTRQDNLRNLRRGEIVGFVLFWYDNLLIVTGEAETAATLRREIAEAAQGCNAMWKASDNGDQFTCGVNQVTYLGIEAKKEADGKWRWAHTAANRERWISTKEEPRTWLKAARILGVLTWNWIVSGESREGLVDLAGIARKIGKEGLATKTQWMRLSPATTGVTVAEWGMLESRLEDACRDKARLYEGPVETAFGRCVLLASDAMETKGAGVWMKGGRKDDGPRVIWSALFEDPDKYHINWKETWSALETVWSAITKNPTPRTLYIVAVDNTTARAVLSAGFVPWDGVLNARMAELKDRLHKLQSAAIFVYIPGKRQPADEPSRDEEINPDKVRECIQWLEESQYPWWVISERVPLTAKKRSRSPHPEGGTPAASSAFSTGSGSDQGICRNERTL